MLDMLVSERVLSDFGEKGRKKEKESEWVRKVNKNEKERERERDKRNHWINSKT